MCVSLLLDGITRKGQIQWRSQTDRVPGRVRTTRTLAGQFEYIVYRVTSGSLKQPVNHARLFSCESRPYIWRKAALVILRNARASHRLSIGRYSIRDITHARRVSLQPSSITRSLPSLDIAPINENTSSAAKSKSKLYFRSDDRFICSIGFRLRERYPSKKCQRISSTGDPSRT